MRAIVGTPANVDAHGLVELGVTPIGPLRTQTGAAFIETWTYADFVDVRDAQTGVAVAGWTFGEVRFKARDLDVSLADSPRCTSRRTTLRSSARRSRAAPASSHRTRLDEEPIVIVGYRFWQDRLGADPNVIGSTISLNRVPHVVVGIAPERYRGHLSPEGSPDVSLWLPLDSHPRLAGPGESAAESRPRMAPHPRPPVARHHGRAGERGRVSP